MRSETHYCTVQVMTYSKLDTCTLYLLTYDYEITNYCINTLIELIDDTYIHTYIHILYRLFKSD